MLLPHVDDGGNAVGGTVSSPDIAVQRALVSPDARSGAMKILLVVPRYPWPPRRGDQLRTAQTIDLLAGEHELTVLAPAPPAGVAAPPSHLSCRLLTYRRSAMADVMGGLVRVAGRSLPLQSALFYRQDLRRRIRELAPSHDLAMLQLVRLVAHSDDIAATPLVVDLIDSLSLNLARRAEVDRPWRRAALRLEANRLARAETRLLARAVAALVVCERDRRVLAAHGGQAAHPAAPLAVVPIAVSAEAVATTPPAADGPATISLTGNLGYFVNDDAARWFLAAVWPRLRAAAPGVRLLVAGDRPGRGLRRVAAASGAELVASPPDLRALLARATLALAPMRCGSGLPLKVLEAWSSGVPVVASPWAAAGTSGVAGEDLVVAESPDEWMRAILALLADPDRRRQLAAAGRERLRADYSPQVVRRALLAALTGCNSAHAAGGRPAPPPRWSRRE